MILIGKYPTGKQRLVWCSQSCSSRWAFSDLPFAFLPSFQMGGLFLAYCGQRLGFLWEGWANFCWAFLSNGGSCLGMGKYWLDGGMSCDVEVLFVHVSSNLTCHKDIRTNTAHLPFYLRQRVSKLTYLRKRVSKLTSTLKGSKLTYDSYIERFKGYV